MRLGTGPRLLTRPGLRTHDTRVPVGQRHLSVSLVCLQDILEQAARLEIGFYRMSAQLLPLLGTDDLPTFWQQLQESETLACWIGGQANRRGTRLTVHPMLDVQLGSEDDDLAQRSRTVAIAWSALMDCMDLGRESCIVVHVGGTARENSLEAFSRNLDRLPEPTRQRLAVENDDRHFSLGDVLWLSAREGTPVVWDYLHWRCLNPEGIPAQEAAAAAAATWPAGLRPKAHFSSPRTSPVRGRPPTPRQHAEYVDPFAFADYLAWLGPTAPWDVMLEAGAKDLALLKLRADLDSTHHRNASPEERTAVATA